MSFTLSISKEMCATHKLKVKTGNYRLYYNGSKTEIMVRPHSILFVNELALSQHIQYVKSVSVLSW